MIRDYEIIPLSEQLAAQISEGAAYIVESDASIVYVKTWIKRGDLYRQLSFMCNKEDVGTKEFTLRIVESFFVLRHAIEIAKTV